MNDDFKNDGLRDLIVERDGYLEQLEEAYKTINQLTNNWNELEEWLEKQRIRNSEWEKFVQKDTRLGIPIGYLLDKMKEIKEGNNVSSRD